MIQWQAQCLQMKESNIYKHDGCGADDESVIYKF